MFTSEPIPGTGRAHTGICCTAVYLSGIHTVPRSGNLLKIMISNNENYLDLSQSQDNLKYSKDILDWSTKEFDILSYTRYTLDMASSSRIK